MDPITTATLGDEDFPPKNGVIIKQGNLFIQESRRILFMKWKVWRKRWITLRYLSKTSPSVLQIESRNPVTPSSLLLSLTANTCVEIIDSSGPQDLAGAKVLQLQLNELDEHAEPLIFKHPSLDEMSDWIAAFRLTVALGETGSICSDTDNSSSWAGSQAAPSPVSSESPVHTTFTFDLPVSYVLRIEQCSIAVKSGLVIGRDYELRLDQQGLSLHDDGKIGGNLPTAHWRLESLRKVQIDGGVGSTGGKENEVTSQVTVTIAAEDGTGEEDVLVVRSGEAVSLFHRLQAAVAGTNACFTRKPFVGDQKDRSHSRNSKRRPGSDRPRKRPILGLMKQHSRLSTDLPSPVTTRAPSILHREMSLQLAGRRKDLSHMDSRDSLHSSNDTPDIQESPENAAHT